MHLLPGWLSYSRLRAWLGPLLAGVIMGLWSLSLAGTLALSVQTHFSLWEYGLVILGRTFLQTGLFIVAHDAMHGSLFPRRPSINHGIGQIALGLYGLLPYRRAVANHWRHHRWPTTIQDPDFSQRFAHQPVRWYLAFMQAYVDQPQILRILVGLGFVYGILILGFQVSVLTILLIWALPAWLSSVQLFVFGTYLPHRPATTEWQTIHCARSSGFSELGSLLACYHLDYHWEHHAYPQVPWYQLPQVRKAAGSKTVTGTFK